MIEQITKALKAKYGATAWADIYKNEADKEVVEFSVKIPRGPKQQPKTAGITLNCKYLPDNCRELVLTQIAKGLAEF